MLEYGTWNLQGKSLVHLGDWMTTVGFGCDFICLQEVGGLGELVTTDVPGQLQQFYVSSESDLHDSFILGSVDTQSYLGQVIVLDKLVVDRILQSSLGTRWIAVRFVDVQHTARFGWCSYATS